MLHNHRFVLPVEVRATGGLLSAEAGFGFWEGKKKEMESLLCKKREGINLPLLSKFYSWWVPVEVIIYKLLCDWRLFSQFTSAASLLQTQKAICWLHKSMTQK